MKLKGIRVCIVAAIADDGAIGTDGMLPWHCPKDLKRFRLLTTGRVCLMGRKTAESLTKPLRDRVNMVLTRDRTWRKPGFITVHTAWDIKRVLKTLQQTELWVIGGAEIYRLFMPTAHVVHLTRLQIKVPAADTWFPMGLLRRFKGVYLEPSTDPKVQFWVLRPKALTPNRRGVQGVCYEAPHRFVG